MIKRRQNLYIIFKLNKILSVSYNRLKNMVTSTIRNSENLFQDIKSDTEKTWTAIKSITRPKNSKKTLDIKSLLCNDK